ncbi:hypothetical protein GW765_00100 [Candidatus Parcubacteria bacterium]|nr:hypothetical protein [Candidatus Parcubacteria bacterium]
MSHYSKILFDPKNNKFCLEPEGRDNPPNITDEMLDTASRILNVIHNVLGIKPEDVLIKTRKREITEARYNFFAMMRFSFSKLSYQEIGAFVEGKKSSIGMDHSSVHHAEITHNNNCDTDSQYRIRAKAIEDIFKENVLPEEALLNRTFSFKEMKEVLIRNGVPRPFFSREMFPEKFAMKVKTSVNEL